MAYPDKSAYAQCIVAYCEGPGHEIKVRESKGREKYWEGEREKGEKSIEREREKGEKSIQREIVGFSGVGSRKEARTWPVTVEKCQLVISA